MLIFKKSRFFTCVFLLAFMLSFTQSKAQTQSQTQTQDQHSKDSKRNSTKKKKEKVYRFTPHISSEAFTREKGKFGFSRSASANLNTSLWLSSFFFAITDRIEIGTTPINYFVEGHRFNVQGKYNFYRTQRFLWSVALSIGQYVNKVDGIESEIDLVSGQVTLNYIPDFTQLRFGFFVSRSTFTVKEIDDPSDMDKKVLFLRGSHQFGVDISYPTSKNTDLTLGWGWLRSDGFSALEDVNFGFGSSFRIYRSGKIFSSPTLGLHYTPTSNDFDFIFSTSIY